MALTEDFQKRGSSLVVWMSIIAIAVVALGIWASVNPDVPIKVAEAAVAVGEAVSEAVGEVVAEATTALETEATADGESDKSGDTPGAAVTPPTGVGARPRATSPATPAASVQPPEGTLDTSSALPDSIVPPPEAVVPSPAPDEVIAPSAPPVAAPPDPRIYDTTNADVLPPPLVRPQAIAPLNPEQQPPSPGTLALEIMVNEDGTVASVKATSKPTSLAQALDLYNASQFAKTWKFSPALKNGQPVKYRVIVPLKTALTRGTSESHPSSST